LRREDPALAATLVAAKAVDYASVTAVLNVLKTGWDRQPNSAGPGHRPRTTRQHRNKSGWPTGRVTDEEGKPIEGVLISVDAGMGSLFQTGKATTGADGHYTVEFTQGVMMERGHLPGLQFANITAHKQRFLREEPEPSRRGAMALREVAAEDLERLRRSRRRARAAGPAAQSVDFVMLPAARLKGRLLGTETFSDLTPAEVRKDPKQSSQVSRKLDHAPLAGWQLWLKGQGAAAGRERDLHDAHRTRTELCHGGRAHRLRVAVPRRDESPRRARGAVADTFFKLRKRRRLYDSHLDLPEKQDNFELNVTSEEISTSGKYHRTFPIRVNAAP
jgi:hypothetical protein